MLERVLRAREKLLKVNDRLPRVCLVGTAPPRRCGIATFTSDLRAALAAPDPGLAAVQVAVTDSGGTYEYGADVVFEVQANQLSDYRAAAEFIEQAEIDVVNVQHEFGIFGGGAGRYIDELLDHVRAPVVTTLHTVLSHPSAAQREATRRLADRSDRLVVLAHEAVRLLGQAYAIPSDKVTVIQHGVPDVPAVDTDAAKASVAADGRIVVLTFGLLSPSKGIEVVLDALPAVVARHPDVLYVVLGATHPHVRRDHGEVYRESLEEQVGRLGLGDHVRFEDRYVDLDELCTFLAATDIYVTPYHSVDQIVSGTLAYAVGMGRAVVSTPYPYAQELLAEGRGRVVPYADPRALAGELNSLLDDPVACARMRELAFDFGREMTWPSVARQYATVFAEVIDTHERPRRAWVRPAEARSPSFAYLRAITDDTGLFQHVALAVPDRVHGYCTDDVGRALVAAIQGVARCADADATSLVPTYLSFLKAAQRGDGRFDNLLGYDRRFVPATDSEDTLGQALWGLGAVVSASPSDDWRAAARAMFEHALVPASELRAPRAAAYAISGLYGYLERLPGGLAVRRVMQRLATDLEARLDDHRSRDWHWFEPHLTYANAKKPHALLLAGRACDHDGWVAAGLSTLEFLIRTTFIDGQFDFVGNAGWYPRGGRRAVFGQQPIEAGYTAEACMVAYEITGELHHLELAHAALEWLLGRNRLGVALYDPVTGRCADGLDRHGASANAGAESTICALLALLAVPTPERLAHQREERPAAATPE